MLSTFMDILACIENFIILVLFATMIFIFFYNGYKKR